jgi:hypothetical protein
VNKWEYMERTFAALDDGHRGNRLARYGQEGWELIAVVGSGKNRTFYFKRPLRSAAPTFTQADGFEVYER